MFHELGNYDFLQSVYGIATAAAPGTPSMSGLFSPAFTDRATT